jgi:response regulator of citrate/malate metabolism
MYCTNIVILEDDEEDSGFFTTVVNEISPSTKVHVTGRRQELFTILHRTIPDLLFLDCFVQLDSGIDCIQEIKSHSGLKTMPIIMYTGSADYRNVTSSFRAGASMYIVKPNSLQEIRKVLNYLLEEDWVKRGVLKQYYQDGEFHNYSE